MARMPGAIWNPLPENSFQPYIVPTQVILHTAVDKPGSTNLQRYFARTDIRFESHFWVALDGIITQMMDTEVRADANRRANLRPDGTGAVSIETEDEGDPVGIPWTEAQLDSIVDIIRWMNETHGVPMIETANPSASGVGYHSMWGAPSDWTPSVGKTCPGQTRINQFREVILPRLLEEEVKMNEAEARRWAVQLYHTILSRTPDESGLEYWSGMFVGLTQIDALVAFIDSAARETSGTQAKIKSLEARITQMESAGVVSLDVLAQRTAELLVARLTD